MSEGPAYGYEMTKRLRARGLSTVGEGSIYPLLGRLERDGLVETRRAASNGGPPRKYYSLSQAGERRAGGRETGMADGARRRRWRPGPSQSGGTAVNEFVEECRREWRRLGVPDPIANEMAADLAADIEEAESEGGTAEDVLGNSAFDPRHFAGSWAVARGVSSARYLSPAKRRWPATGSRLDGCSRHSLTLAAAGLGGRSPECGCRPCRLAGLLADRDRSMCFLAIGLVQPFPALRRHWPFRDFSCWSLLWSASASPLYYGSRWSGGRIGPWEIRRDRARSGAL